MMRRAAPSYLTDQSGTGNEPAMKRALRRLPSTWTHSIQCRVPSFAFPWAFSPPTCSVGNAGTYFCDGHRPELWI